MSDGRGLLIAVVAIVATFAGITGAQQNAELFAAAPTWATEAAPAHTAADPYALLAQHAPGVTITWTDDAALNCGGYGGGCFTPQYPGTIMVSPAATATMLEYVVLHEAAHVLQYRAAQPLDECAADAQAVAWGALAEITAYLNTPTCNTETKEG